MKILGIIDEDFVNYKKISMVIEMPYCSFKCDKECGRNVCQNSELAKAEKIDIPIHKLVSKYLSNPITEAICFQGLEPFDSEHFEEYLNAFRSKTDDDIVIYTGYTKEEINSLFPWIYNYNNIILKVGRFIPDQPSHYDKLLGVFLASSNQYAIKIN